MWLIELLLQRWGGAVFAAALKECFCCVRVSVQGVDSRGPTFVLWVLPFVMLMLNGQILDTIIITRAYVYIYAGASREALILINCSQCIWPGIDL